jgi:predicted DNA-binding transcriptional regulator AlpA
MNEIGSMLALKRWLDPDEFFMVFGISLSTQAKMRMASSSSKIPFSKIGGKFIRYDRNAIDKWLEEHQVQGSIA